MASARTPPESDGERAARGPASGRRLLLIIVFAAALLRLWGIWFGLPATSARPDEETFIDTSLQMFYRGPNPHLFNYSSLYLYVMAAVEAVWFPIERVWGTASSTADFVRSAIAHPAALLLADRIMAALFGTATVALMFYAARALFSTRVALIAASLLAVAFLHVRESHFGVPDVPATFMIVLAFWVIVSHPLDWRHRRDVAAAALVCGLAASTKYNAAIVVCPLAVVLLAQAREMHTSLRRVATLLSIAGLAALAGFLIGSPFVVLDAPAFHKDLAFERAHLLNGHGVDVGRGWIRHLQFSLWYGVGWPMLAAAAAGTLVLLAAAPYAAAVVLSFPVVYYAALGAGKTVFLRYIVPVVPFVCLLAAVGIERVASLAVPRRSGRAHTIVVVALTAAAASISIGASVSFDGLLSKTDNRLRAARWLEQAFPDGGSVLQTANTLAHVQLSAKFHKWPHGPHTDILRLAHDSLPELLIVPTSPPDLRWQDSFGDARFVAGDRLERLIAAHYRALKTFDVNASGDNDPGVYDPQDAFYVPVHGFDSIERPGPAIAVYERK